MVKLHGSVVKANGATIQCDNYLGTTDTRYLGKLSWITNLKASARAAYAPGFSDDIDQGVNTNDGILLEPSVYDNGVDTPLIPTLANGPATAGVCKTDYWNKSDVDTVLGAIADPELIELVTFTGGASVFDDFNQIFLANMSGTTSATNISVTVEGYPAVPVPNLAPGEVWTALVQDTLSVTYTFDPMVPDIDVSTAVLNFGEQHIAGGESTGQTVDIENVGYDQLQFTGAGFTLAAGDVGDFAITNNPSTDPIYPEGQRTIEVAFDPTTEGVKTATLEITTNDPDEATVVVSLNGKGIDPPQVLSSNPADPAVSSAATVDFDVVFNESVTGVTFDNTFAVGTTGSIVGASVTALSGSGDTYVVTVNTGNGDGTLRLDVLEDTAVTDSNGSILAGGFVLGQHYIVDKTDPVVTVYPLTTDETTPEILGTVSDALSGVKSVDVTVNSVTYPATVAANLWWADVTTPLAEGAYDVDVVAEDNAGNTATDPTASELNVNLGGGPSLSVTVVGPTEINVPEGGTATLQVAVQNATGTPHYQWYFEARPDLKSKVFGEVVGATGPVLEITSATLNDTGVFFCRVQDDVDMEQSEDITVVVHETTGTGLWVEVISPSEIEVQERTQVRPEVEAHNADGPVNYQWYFQPVGGGKVFTAIDGATLSSLDLGRVAFEDAGIYYCEVEDNSDSAQSSGILLEVMPYTGSKLSLIVLGPTERTVRTGSPISLEVVAQNNFGIVHHQWYFEPLGDGKIFDAIDGADEAVHGIDPAAPAHSGTYYCDANDDYDSAQSVAIGVFVYEGTGPALWVEIVGDTERNVTGGSPVEIEVSVHNADGPVTFQWYFEQNDLGGGKVYELVEGAGSAILTIGEASLDHSGVYYAQVSDFDDTVQSSGVLLNISKGVPAAGLTSLTALSGVLALGACMCIRRRRRSLR